ncbi:methyltransferase [Haematobacter missouriensis]|uniref:Putative 4-hydroxy-4-methyl-2-oxoglutarate aldolase n=2 Tax=Haematobacter missouriensis TaxID=366616 RepID=A0A225CV81_9RHOB|nr:methyltransferase [Haematobacter missouriensis]OWJ81233.1 methyltransferase [Haematobacter missouriensis]
MTAMERSDALTSLVVEYRSTTTAVISDNLDRLPGAVGLRPYHLVRGTMAGRALTVRVAAGDNYYIHKALDLVQPGDVVVVDGDGSTERALIGGIMSAIAKSRGAAGMVLNGAIRDTAEIGADDFPIFACGVTHRGPYKNGPGAINVPVVIGGMIVNPGDIVVGDHDGVVAFPPQNADKLLESVRAQERKEAEIFRQIAAGTYVGAYAK